MESILIFNSEKDVRFKKLLKFIIPTYLTSLFTTVILLLMEFLFPHMSELML